jgi:site-specific DNA-methyltransferase (adenine-specific)
MALQKAMVSSKTNEWETPKWLFDELNGEFHFTLDPCATPTNTKCPRYYTKEQNGLVYDWKDEVVFMNPPYGGNTGKWLAKAWHDSLRGAIVVCLIVSSTDRSYWHDYIFPYATEVRWLRGRITFGDANSTAPFASAIVIFSNKRKEGEPQKQQFYKHKKATWQYIMV